MPFDVTIEPERRLIRSTWSGAVDAALLTDYLETVWADPSVRAFRELIDFREVSDVEVPTEALYEIAEASRLLDNPDEPARSAVVAPPGLIYGLSRMFSSIRAMAPDDRREFRVFGEIDEARRWLGTA